MGQYRYRVKAYAPVYTPFRSVLNKRHWRLEPPQAISNGHMPLRSQGTCELFGYFHGKLSLGKRSGKKPEMVCCF